jgi:hypothetical protein
VVTVGVCERQPSSGFNAHIQTQLASLHTLGGILEHYLQWGGIRSGPQFRCPFFCGDFRMRLAFEQAPLSIGKLPNSQMQPGAVLFLSFSNDRPER